MEDGTQFSWTTTGIAVAMLVASERPANEYGKQSPVWGRTCKAADEFTWLNWSKRMYSFNVSVVDNRVSCFLSSQTNMDKLFKKRKQDLRATTSSR